MTSTFARAAPFATMIGTAVAMLAVGLVLSSLEDLVEDSRHAFIFLLLGPLVLLAGLVAVWCMAMRSAIRRRQWAALITGVVVLTPGLVLIPAWWVAPALHGLERYWVLRPYFDQIADVARSDELRYVKPDYWNYRNARLPDELCTIAVPRCEVVKLEKSNGEPVLFVRHWTAFSGDSNPGGFGHFVGQPDRSHTYGLWDTYLCPTLELGGGWHWMEYTWPDDCAEASGFITPAGIR